MNVSNALQVDGYPLPSQYIAVWRDAIELSRRGRLGASIERMAMLASEEPSFMPARVQLSYFLLAADRYREARRLALEVAETDPRTIEFALQIVRLLRRFEEIEHVARVVDRVDWNTCNSASLLLQAAGELGPIALYERARSLLDRADTLAPAGARSLYLRGTLELMAGQSEQANASLRRALAASASTMPHVRWMLTLQPQTDCIGPDIAALQRELALVDRDGEGEAYLCFGLHGLLNAFGDYEQAWHMLERGCRAKRAQVRYDRKQQRELFNALSQIVPKQSNFRHEVAGVPRVVFIVGMHRSGTSLLERILSGHPEIADGGESYVFTAALREAADHFCEGVVDHIVAAKITEAALLRVGKRFRDYARWHAKSHACFTEKLPSNFLNLGFILQAMPDARILHLKRDPMDTCFSNLRTFFSHAAPYSYDQRELADYYLMYAQLMRHWHQAFPGRILDVDYRDLVADPEGQARQVLAFCGLGFEGSVLDVARTGGYSATASIGNVRRGILKDRGGAWRPYERELGPMLEALAIGNGVVER